MWTSSSQLESATLLLLNNSLEIMEIFGIFKSALSSILLSPRYPCSQARRLPAAYDGRGPDHCSRFGLMQGLSVALVPMSRLHLRLFFLSKNARGSHY